MPIPALSRANTAPTERMADRMLVAAAAAVLVGVAAPVIWNGAPLADEYHLCTRPEREGFSSIMAEYWTDTGVVRPIRYVELALIGGLCGAVPFGLLIVIPLVIKLAGAPLLWMLLRDVRVPSPWPAMGAALWLLEPLGTEAALWPAALHVNLGLILAIAAIWLQVHGRTAAGMALVLGACLSVEQAIFALPLAAWLLVPGGRRRQATLATAAVCLLVLAAYATWPGVNPRQDVPLDERLRNVVADPMWYIRFPVVGLGLHSGAVAFVWALPWSLVVVTGMAAIGWRYGAALAASGSATVSSNRLWRGVLPAIALLALVNVPLVVTEVGQSPRTFTPSWLVVAAGAAIAGSRLPVSRLRAAGLLAGAFAGFAVLSLSLSAWVRVETVAFDRSALGWIASRISDGAVVAICNVERTAVEPAPAGAFHLHAFHSQYDGALRYHTGRTAEMRRSGTRYWGTECPDLEGAHLIVDFEDLKVLAGR